MKAFLTSVVGIVLVGGFGAATLAANPELKPVPLSGGKASISPENTRIQFVGTHAGPKPDPRTGVFTKFTGIAEVDPEKKSLKKVTVDIKTDSLSTPIEKLTNHLKSPDFFDTREYPTAKFESTSIRPSGADGKHIVTGNLTMLKATKEIKIPAKITVDAKGLTLNADFTIDRSQFGMSGFTNNVNKDVAMTVSVGLSTPTPPTK